MLNRQICSYQEKQYIRNSLIQNIRIDGRENSEYRRVAIKHSILQHLPGSAYAQVYYDNIEIYVGVKAKVLKKTSYCMQKLQVEQVQIMESMRLILQKNYVEIISNNFNLTEDLKILNSLSHCIGIFIDIFLLSTPHFSQLQLMQSLIQVALNNTQIPNLHAIINQINKEEKIQILANYKKLNMTLNRDIRMLVIGYIEGTFISDLKSQEYEAISTVILVVIVNGKVVGIQLLKGQLGPNIINKCVTYAISHSENTIMTNQ